MYHICTDMDTHGLILGWSWVDLETCWRYSQIQPYEQIYTYEQIWPYIHRYKHIYRYRHMHRYGKILMDIDRYKHMNWYIHMYRCWPILTDIDSMNRYRHIDAFISCLYFSADINIWDLFISAHRYKQRYKHDIDIWTDINKKNHWCINWMSTEHWE